MRLSLGRLLGLLVVLAAAVTLSACGGLLPKNSPARSVQPLKQELVNKIKEIGSTPGAPMMIRVFKQSSEFEVWKQASSGQFKLLKSYAICAYSGGLGPKLVEGDRQSPEGFYDITPALMNPNSNYYLAYNTGFPNKFDRAWGRTGANLMVHGVCSSAGCYAMTDEAIAEIYALARETFNGGSAVIQMQIFPFRMTPRNLAAEASNPNMPFWMDIKEGYDRFELSKKPPSWDVCNKKYVFDMGNSAPLDSQGACPARGADPLATALAAKQQADNAEIKTDVAELTDSKAKSDAAQASQDATVAAEKARGQAIGNFFSGLTGGGQAQPPTAPAATGTTLVAPVPHPAPKGV